MSYVAPSVQGRSVFNNYKFRQVILLFNFALKIRNKNFVGIDKYVKISDKLFL